MTRWIGHGASGGMVAALVVALSCTGITQEELVCEHAVSRISDCCPNVDARLLPCVETQGGCTSGEAAAVLTLRAGECVLEQACDAFRAAKKCETISAYALVPHVNKDRAKLEAEVCK